MIAKTEKTLMSLLVQVTEIPAVPHHGGFYHWLLSIHPVHVWSPRLSKISAGTGAAAAACIQGEGP